MAAKMKRLPSALKHGGYSAKNILPGESSSGFKRLHRGIIAELCPDGALEHEIATSITELVWRKQNPSTFRKVKLVKQRYQAILSEYLPPEPFESLLVYENNEKPRREGGFRAADDQARKELGKDYPLVEKGDTATVEYLMRELEVEERLVAMIDKELKRLLLLRGIKSLPRASASNPSLPAPHKAA